MEEKTRWIAHALGNLVVAAVVVLTATGRTYGGLTSSTRNAVVGSTTASGQRTAASASDFFTTLQAVVASPDSDQDGIPDWSDNCPQVPNPDQADSDGDGVGNVCDNCPNDFNPAQTDTLGDGVGDLCNRSVSPSSVFTLKLVRLRVNSARFPRSDNGRVLVRGVLDQTQFGEPLLDTLNRGLIIGVSGAGLGAPETMVFRNPYCIAITKTFVTCIGTRGEIANFRRQRRAPHFYNVNVTAPHRSFLAPLSRASARVVLSNSGYDRSADLLSCRIYAKRFAGCRNR